MKNTLSHADRLLQFVLIMVVFAYGLPDARADAGIEQRVAELAGQHASRLEFSEGRFSGPAWELLVAEGQSAQFFLLGEEHGIAENPRLAAALFKALVPAGYSRFAIETSPQMAKALNDAAADGLEGLQRLYADPSSNAVFFGMLEEAEMLAEVRAAVPGNEPVLWGLDYEVLADRYLLDTLEAKKKPGPASEALSALRTASDTLWEKYGRTGDAKYIFSFAADPVLVERLRDAWTAADPDTGAVLHTLIETLTINRLWVNRKVWASNARRAALLRNNFLRYWQQQPHGAGRSKVFFKLGATHLVRGRSMTEVYDLGTMLPEIAAQYDGKAFHLLVLPGKNSATAVFDPRSMRYNESTPRNSYLRGLELITDQVATDAYTLIDLRPIRPHLNRPQEGITQELQRIVHGFDAVLVMSGSTASKNILPVSGVRPH